jgi:hypothetical protein
MVYISESWMSAHELCERLADFVGNEEYGDVFARFTASEGAERAIT